VSEITPTNLVNCHLFFFLHAASLSYNTFTLLWVKTHITELNWTEFIETLAAIRSWIDQYVSEQKLWWLQILTVIIWGYNEWQYGWSAGFILVLLHAVVVISAFTKCYPVNGQNYCFYTDGSVLSWEEAREFCESRNSTLPIITDEHINNEFQQFISDNNNVRVSDSDTWLGAHAQHVNDSDKWHWINGQSSGS